jgi:hypothetical protein
MYKENGLHGSVLVHMGLQPATTFGIRTAARVLLANGRSIYNTYFRRKTAVADTLAEATSKLSTLPSAWSQRRAMYYVGRSFYGLFEIK